MFGHSISKLAQATRSGAMPCYTLGSPLSTSRVRSLAERSMLQQGTEKTGFGNSYVWMFMFIFVQCIPHCHTQFILFPIRDNDSPTHPLIATCSPSATIILLVQDKLKQHSMCISQISAPFAYVGFQPVKIDSYGLPGRASIKRIHQIDVFVLY